MIDIHKQLPPPPPLAIFIDMKVLHAERNKMNSCLKKWITADLIPTNHSDEIYHVYYNGDAPPPPIEFFMLLSKVSEGLKDLGFLQLIVHRFQRYSRTCMVWPYHILLICRNTKCHSNTVLVYRVSSFCW